LFISGLNVGWGGCAEPLVLRFSAAKPGPAVALDRFVIEASAGAVMSELAEARLEVNRI